jgi:exo-beta-1,3-glucanase (GH17 family)
MIRILLLALVATLIGAFWYAMGRPIAMPPSPLASGEKLNCLSYAPFHGRRAPYDRPLRIPDAEVEADLQKLAAVTSCIRTYSSGRSQAKITRLAGKYGLNVLQGIWIGRNRAENRREIEAGLRLARRYPGVIEAFIVGNETLLRGELSAAPIKAYLDEVKRRSHLPVTYADVWEFWLRSPELVSAADFVTVHILPYWEDDPVAASEAVAHVTEIREEVAKSFPGKEILIGEVGWPSQGRMRDGALPSPANQALVLSGVVETAKARGWKVNLIEAFDQPWKRLLEGTVGGYWGLFNDSAGALKFRWGAPVSNYPQWRLMAAIGIGAAFLIFAAAWLGPGRDASRQRDVAVAAIALGAGLFFGWAVLGLPMEPPDPGDRLRSAGMIVLALLVPMTAAAAVARKAALGSLAVALNPSLWRNASAWTVALAVLFAATLVAAIHVALGLAFDPRYKDFQLALLSGPAIAFAVSAAVMRPAAPVESVAEWVAAGLLAGSALFVMPNEGLANWQAQWFAGLLALLAFTAWRATPARS